MDTQNQNPSPSNAPSNSTIMGILAYLGILVIVPLVAAKDDHFVKFHAKQGLVLFICEVIGWFVITLPVFGWFLAPIIELGFLVFMIIGIMNVVNKQTKELPLIGHLASNFKF